MVDANRVLLAGKGSGGWPPLDNLQCSRSLWVGYDLMYAGVELDAMLEELEKDRRQCRGFFGWKRGWSPREHLDLVLRALDWKQRLLFMALGSFFTLLVAWVMRLLGIA